MLIGLILGAVLGVVKISYDRSYNHVAHFYEKGKELHDEKTGNEWKEYYLTERDMFWLTLKE